MRVHVAVAACALLAAAAAPQPRLYARPQAADLVASHEGDSRARVWRHRRTRACSRRASRAKPEVLLAHVLLHVHLPDFGAVDVALRIDGDAFRGARALMEQIGIGNEVLHLAVLRLPMRMPRCQPPGCVVLLLGPDSESAT